VPNQGGRFTRSSPMQPIQPVSRPPASCAFARVIETWLIKKRMRWRSFIRYHRCWASVSSLLSPRFGAVAFDHDRVCRILRRSRSGAGFYVPRGIQSHTRNASIQESGKTKREDGPMSLVRSCNAGQTYFALTLLEGRLVLIAGQVMASYGPSKPRHCRNSNCGSEAGWSIVGRRCRCVSDPRSNLRRRSAANINDKFQLRLKETPQDSDSLTCIFFCDITR
jgi:hypothetical protein